MGISVVFLAYFIGSVPFALILARRWSVADLRLVGSGNVGATNVMRASGVKAGVLVALLDMSKGALSVWLARQFTADPAAPAAAGLAAMIGHIYPVWIRFRGGKGVATACGVFAMLTPAAAASAFGLFVAVVWSTKYVSLGSIVASVVLPPIAYLTGSSGPNVLAASIAAAVIVFRHRTNLRRLWSGLEPSFGKAPADKPGAASRA